MIGYCRGVSGSPPRDDVILTDGTRAAAAALISPAGSIITRFAWIEAGRQSAEDLRVLLALPAESDQRAVAAK